MDFIFEAIFTALIEGIGELIKSKKVPFLIRVLLAVLIVGLSGFLVGGTILGGIRIFSERPVGTVVLFAIALFLMVLTVLLVWAMYKVLRNK